MIRLFISAESVSIIHRPFYHYGQNNMNSLTKVYSPEHIRQVTNNVYEVERYVRESAYAGLLSPYLPLLKLNIKLPLLMTDDTARYRQWLEWFPEANGYVMHNKQISLRTRFIQWLAVKQNFSLLKLYHRCVFRLIYGTIYTFVTYATDNTVFYCYINTLFMLLPMAYALKIRHEEGKMTA